MSPIPAKLNGQSKCFPGDLRVSDPVRLDKGAREVVRRLRRNCDKGRGPGEASWALHSSEAIPGHGGTRLSIGKRSPRVSHLYSGLSNQPPRYSNFSEPFGVRHESAVTITLVRDKNVTNHHRTAKKKPSSEKEEGR